MGIERFIFGNPTLDLLKRSLDVQSLRSELVASNLANVDTPEYKARDVDFGKVLSAEENRLGGDLPMKTSHPGHLGGSADGHIPIKVNEDDSTSMRQDGNTVDQDTEMQKLAEIQMLYEASVNALAKRYSLLNTVISNAKI